VTAGLGRAAETVGPISKTLFLLLEPKSDSENRGRAGKTGILDSDRFFSTGIGFPKFLRVFLGRKSFDWMNRRFAAWRAKKQRPVCLARLAGRKTSSRNVLNQRISTANP
jgi:hypothetical protein